jgi:hypothetical protein
MSCLYATDKLDRWDAKRSGAAVHIFEGIVFVLGDHYKIWQRKIAEGFSFEALLEELETIWKGLCMDQSSQHQPGHCGIDECFARRAEPLIILAQAPTLPDPAGGSRHPATDHN